MSEQLKKATNNQQRYKITRLNILIMKNVLVFSILLMTATLFAQKDETIFSDVSRTGAWGGPIFEYSNLDEDVQTTGGGGGALVLNDFYLGGYGMGKVEFSKIFQSDDRKDNLNFKHGGFWVGYTPLQGKVIHPYASVRLGWGKARFDSYDLKDNEKLTSLKDNIFVTTPEVGLEVNVFSFFRIAATASYRWVNGIDDLPNYNDDDLSSFGVGLTLRFGGFGNDDHWGRDDDRD